MKKVLMLAVAVLGVSGAFANNGPQPKPAKHTKKTVVVATKTETTKTDKAVKVEPTKAVAAKPTKVEVSKSVKVK